MLVCNHLVLPFAQGQPSVWYFSLSELLRYILGQSLVIVPLCSFGIRSNQVLLAHVPLRRVQGLGLLYNTNLEYPDD